MLVWGTCLPDIERLQHSGPWERECCFSVLNSATSTRSRGTYSFVCGRYESAQTSTEQLPGAFGEQRNKERHEERFSSTNYYYEERHKELHKERTKKAVPEAGRAQDNGAIGNGSVFTSKAHGGECEKDSHVRAFGSYTVIPGLQAL